MDTKGYRLVRSLFMYPKMGRTLSLEGEPVRIGVDQPINLASPAHDGRRALLHAITPNGHLWAYADADEYQPA